MNVLIVAATPFEITPLLTYLNTQFEKDSNGIFHKEKLQITPLITGVGQVATAFHLGSHLSKQSYDFVINVGIAGTFRKDWPLGAVVQVITEQFGQLGAETAAGQFTDLFEMNLLDKNQFPFSDGKLQNSYLYKNKNILQANGITVETTNGHETSIAAIRSRFQPDIESMEGAAFFYACLFNKVKFLQLRGISNEVEPRNKDNWKIALGINQVNEELIELLKVIL